MLSGGAAFAVCVGVAGLDLTSFEQDAWFSFVDAMASCWKAGNKSCQLRDVSGRWQRR